MISLLFLHNAGSGQLVKLVNNWTGLHVLVGLGVLLLPDILIELYQSEQVLFLHIVVGGWVAVARSVLA